MADVLMLIHIIGKKESKDLIPCVCQNSAIPVLTRKSDVTSLSKTALKCFEIDVLANDLYSLVTDEKQNENKMDIVFTQVRI